MSADKVGNCPRCTARRNAEREAAIAKVQADYGKIPVDEWIEARDAAYNVDPYQNQTFQQYWEIGVGRDGVFRFEFHASCKVCKLSFSSVQETPVPIEMAP